MKSSVILIPLLGVTWILGVFAVERNTVVFAWLFTIFNSLQVCFVYECILFVVSPEDLLLLSKAYNLADTRTHNYTNASLNFVRKMIALYCLNVTIVADTYFCWLTSI